MATDEITQKVERHWDEEVMRGVAYTIPDLELMPEIVRDPARIRHVSRLLHKHGLLHGIEGKEVLCLGSGGGQESAVFGLLESRVTVLDICGGQLEGDRRAAAHYGYELRTVKGDMRDLSAFEAESFDLVYQSISICFVPDVREVYAEVHRVLRPGGYYYVAHCNPATYPVCFAGGVNGWDGVGYRIAEPFGGGPILVDEEGRENMTIGEPIGEYRHLLTDIFGGLIEQGFVISDVSDRDNPQAPAVTEVAPGSDEHCASIVSEYFGILCSKG
jgi:SAM-dependent methyltransferase